MTWPGGALPEPVLDGDTATYPDVLPDVDLVLTATRMGFSQLLVVNSAPDAATADALSTLDIPVVTTGAQLVEGESGQLQVVAEETGKVLGVAAPPVMWDARTDPRTDQPVALRQMGLAVRGQADAPAARGAAGNAGERQATLILEPDMSLFTAPDTVYPVTIDPTASLGAIADTFVQSNIANSPQGGSMELRTGTYDGGATVARSYLKFDVSPMKNRDISSATLLLWNLHSWSCSPSWTDVRDALPFNADTMTWNSQPIVGAIVANAYGAFGYSSACPANWLGFNMTNWSQVYADVSNNRPNDMHLAVWSANEGDNNTWKNYSSGNGWAVPTLQYTFDGNCSIHSGHRVCGTIRDKWVALGGPGGFLGMPTSSETPIAGGWFTHFQGGSIYASASGTYFVRGSIQTRWGQLGWEAGQLGFSIGDEFCGLRDAGCGQHFQQGSIYKSAMSGAWEVAGKVRDKWAATGWENGPLRYPTSGQNGLAGGNSFQSFSGDASGSALVYLASGAPAAYYVQGAIRDQYGALGWETSYLGFPTSDAYPVLGGQRSDFAGGQIIRDAATNTTQWGAGPSTWSGMPGWATNLTFRPTDRVAANVNVGTGNLNLTVAGLAVPGVGGDRGIGVVYNSLHTATGSVDPTGLLGAGFRLTEPPDVRLIRYSDNSVRYLDATGRAAVFEWNAAANRYDSTVGDGGYRLERNPANNWVLTELASHRKMTFRAADGLLISDADRNGVSATFAYDSVGKPTSITGSRGGSTVTYTIGGTGVPAGFLGRMSQTVDGSTRTVVFGYTSNRLTSIVDSAGGTTSFTWTGNDLTQITAPAGGVAAISYDTSRRVTQYVADSGSGRINSTTKLAWAADGNALQVKVTDPNNQVTTYRGDVFGKILDATDPLGHTQKATYSPNNDVLTAIDAMPAANATNYSYNGPDGGFTPTGVSLPTGASASAAYPGTGTGPLRYLPNATTDPQGNATSTSYDAAGNPTSQISGGVTTSTNYNPPAGQATICNGGGKPGQPCTQTDGRGGVTTFGYDAAGNLRTVTPPSGVIKAISYAYDAAGRTKTMTDGKGQVTTYVYDGADRVTQIRYNGATSCSTAANCQRYTYDGNGNLTTRIDAAGTTSYGYDRLNRLTGQTSPATSGGGSQTSSMSYDLAGNLLTFTDPTGTTRYGYDAGNNLVNLAEPGGSCTGTISKCTTYTYNGNDTRTKITYPGGTVVEMLDIDASGRARQYKGTAGGQTVMNLRYTFTGLAGDTSLVQTRTDATVPGNAVQAYSYDGLNRLTRARETVGANVTASWSYCYDPNGNRIFDSISTAATVLCPGQANGPAPTYTYDATDALTGRAGHPASAFAYDNNGAEIRAIGSTTRTGGTWNARGQLTALTTNGTAHSYAYAGEGNKERLAFGDNGYQHTALGVTAQTGTSAATVIREPNGTPVALRTTAGSHYFIADRQGSTIALVTASGAVANRYTYDPYGAERSLSETVANPWQYIGGYRDTTTGLFHLQARYYDPTLGRFTQPDPSGQESNTYVYATSDPCNNSDPTGLNFRCAVASTIAGGAAGFLAGAIGLAGGPIVSGAAGGAAAGFVGTYVGERCNGESQGSSLGSASFAGVVGGFLGGVAGKLFNPS